MHPYQVAALPSLVLGDLPPQTPEAFLFQSEATLEPDVWEELGRLVAGRAEDCLTAFGQQWYRLSTQILNTVARLRAGKLGIDPLPFLRPQTETDITLEQAVKKAMTETHPLARVQALDRCRWNVLDELTAADPWGAPAIFAFALKLRIMERWTRLNEKTGMDRVESFISYNVDKSIELHQVSES